MSELKKMVKEMLAADDRGFTEWEISFLDDMFNRSQVYTKKQAEMIIKIYRDKM